MRTIITGNMAAAIGAKLCRPQVIAVYPITPQTTIIEYLAGMVAKGELNAEYIKVESEHSAMAACVGAAAAGSRVFTATSSHGLALMHEMLWQASGLRLPVVMVNVNRALGAPWNTAPDQCDSLAQRDTGWIQIYCEDGQEVLDTTIQAFRLAETVSLPAMVVSEGFVLSHTSSPVDIPEQEKVDEFLPAYSPVWKLDLQNPAAYGSHAHPADYACLKQNMQDSMRGINDIYSKISSEFYQVFGRFYTEVEYHGPKEPDVLVIVSGTTSGTAKAVVAEKYEEGIALMKIRMFRPFPAEEVRKNAWRANKIAVIDRNISLGSRGVFAEEIRSSLWDISTRPKIFEFILGIGGMDITPEIILKVIDFTSKSVHPPSRPVWQTELEKI